MRRHDRVANAVIGSAIFLGALALVYVVWIHQSELTDLAGIIRYLVLPGALLALLAFSFKLSAARRVNIALAILMTGFALYALEGGLHFAEWYSRLRVSRYIREHSDTRSRLEIIKDVEAQTGERAWPYPVPLYLGDGIDIEGDTVLPLAGISGATTVFCNESGRMAIYEADEHGFNNPAGLHSEETIEFALVGDSFAHGACVSSEHNVAAHLRARNRSAINLGFSGNGPLLALATIKEFAVPLRPKAVIWLYFEGNDLVELELEKSSKRLMRYLGGEGHQDLRSRQDDIDRALKDLFEALRREREREEANPPKTDVDWTTYLNSHPVTSGLLLRKLRSSVRSGFRNARRAFGKDSTEPCIHDLSLFTSILREASESVASAGGQFYFAYLPTWERYRNRYPPGLCREQVLALVRAEGIPATDIDSVFRSTGDPLSLFALTWAAGHYTPEGYRLVAESIDRLVY